MEMVGNEIHLLQHPVGIGQQLGPVGSKDNAYSYYNIALTKEFFGANVSLAYIDTNIDDNNCTIFAGGDNYCGNTLVVSATKTFK